MPIINFGSFSKRRNSTKQPGSLPDSRNCKLKETTSIDSPTFIVTGDDLNYNYAQWGSRYYFITDIRSVHNGLTEIDCALDVLATYKSAILNTTAYVLYDSTPNTELPDNRLPIKTTKSVQMATAAFPWSYLNDGCYILSITGSHGSTGIYKLTPTELNNLVDDVSNIKDNIFISSEPAPDPDDFENTFLSALAYLASWEEWLFGNFLKDAIAHAIGSGSVTENIRDAVYLPFNIGTTVPGPTPTYLGTIPLGTADSPRTLNRLNNDSVVSDPITVNIPWQTNDFRRRSPYTDVYLYLPYIGLIKLSSENLVGQASVTVRYAISLKNGEMICTVSSGGEILGQYPGSVACSAPIGISNINLTKAAQSIIAGISSLASKNVAGVGMAALNFADAVTPNYSCIGGLDGVAGILTNQNITCYTVFHDTIVPPNQNLQIIGSPSMCSKNLGSLTGFCQCLDAHVEADAMGNELEEIDSFLNSGFYIE